MSNSLNATTIAAEAGLSPNHINKILEARPHLSNLDHASVVTAVSQIKAEAKKMGLTIQQYLDQGHGSEPETTDIVSTAQQAALDAHSILARQLEQIGQGVSGLIQQQETAVARAAKVTASHLKQTKGKFIVALAGELEAVKEEEAEDGDFFDLLTGAFTTNTVGNIRSLKAATPTE